LTEEKLKKRDMLKSLFTSCFIIVLFFLSSAYIQPTQICEANSKDCDRNNYLEHENSWNINKNDYLETVEKQVIPGKTSSPYRSYWQENYCSSTCGLQNSSWPMSCHDLCHTSQTPVSTANNPGTEKWRYQTFGEAGTIEAGAIVDKGNIIYFGSMGADQNLYALFSDGSLKWKYHTDDIIWSTPAIADDGTTYIGDYNGGFYAIDRNGTRIWRYGTGDGISSSPAIAVDGTIYFGCNNHRIYALNSNGTKKWDYETGDVVFSDPAIGSDGTIYVGSCDHYLYAIHPDGTLRWRFPTGGEIKGHPSIAADGSIYVPSFDGYLYNVYPDGTMRWRVSTGNQVAAASAAIGSDGTLYVGTELLRAFYPDGSLRWSCDIGGNLWGTSPAISGDGTIYVANDLGCSIVAVNPNGTIKWQKYICNSWARASPCIGPDGSVFVGTSWEINFGAHTFGYLHAFGEASLSVDANGPYAGNAKEPIAFMSTTFGGALPYTYLWEFGDGNTSDLEHPTHTYARPGEYISRFTVIDGEGNSSGDTADVTVGTSRPEVRILRPENALYLFNIKLIPLNNHPCIIGRIKIKVEAVQVDVGIDHVSFYIDYVYRFSDYKKPYEWVWSDRVLFFHTIDVVAFSNDNKTGSATINNVLKFL